MINLGDAVLFFKGDMNDLDRALGEARAAAEDSLGNMKRMAFEAGAAMTAMGASIVGSMALMGSEFVEFEQAFTGVRKTVDASDEELAALEMAFRDLALQVPVSAAELAKIGETAGQLGLQKDNIMGVTKTIVDLGVSSNLAGEEGATMIARFANIVQLPQDQFNNLGSAIVALGNAGASTEQEIMSMALRLAGAGQTAGMTSGDVLGIANALSSVGIEAEAGGSAFSRLIMLISASVAQGGDEIAGFAQVAGMSAEQFIATWNEKPAMAIQQIVAGLGQMHATGQDVFGTLAALGIEDIRLTDAMLRASTAGDLFTQSLALGNQAFKENIALQDESQKFYETSASKIEILKNNVTELSIQLGQAFVPPLLEMMETMKPIVADIVEWVRVHPQLTQELMLSVGAFGLFLSVAGPLLIMLPGIVTAVGLVGPAFALVGAAIVGVAGAIMSPIGLIVGAVAAIGFIAWDVYENWEQVKEALANTWEAIIGVFEYGIAAIGEYSGWIAANIVQAFTDPVAFVMEYWQGLGEFFYGIFEWIGSGVDLLMTNIIDPIWNKLAEFYDWLTGVFSGAFDAAWNIANGLLGGGTEQPQAFARGTGSAPGGMAWVGEEGPELMYVPRGAQVYPAQQSAAMAGGGATVSISIGSVSLPSRAAIQEFNRGLGDEVARRLSARGMQPRIA